MYIRRKVFSLLQDKNGEERYFSTREILLENEEERLFSILDEEDLEQREFGNKENKIKTREWRVQQGKMLKGDTFLDYLTDPDLRKEIKLSNPKDLSSLDDSINKTKIDLLKAARDNEYNEELFRTDKKRLNPPSRRKAHDLRRNVKTKGVIDNHHLSKGVREENLSPKNQEIHWRNSRVRNASKKVSDIINKKGVKLLPKL